MAIALALGGGAALPTATLAKRAPSRLHAFSSCPALVGYAKGHLGQTHGAPGGGVTPLAEPGAPRDGPRPTRAPRARSAKEAAPTYSTTNVQEEGVDEPDVVKTDGTTIFTVAGDTLYAVAATGPGAPRIAGSLKLRRSGGDLLLHGQRLLVIQSASPPIAAEPVAGGAPRLAVAPVSGQTVITEVDVRDPAALKVARTLTLDGQYVNARQNGATARVVLSSTPRAYTVAGRTRRVPRAGCRARASPRGSPGATARGRWSRAARCAGRRPSRVSARCRSSPSIWTRACGRSTPTRS